MLVVKHQNSFKMTLYGDWQRWALSSKDGRTLIDNYGRIVCGKEFQMKAFEAAAVLWEKNSLEGME
jgi:predicted DNA-binding WGR domain protein